MKYLLAFFALALLVAGSATAQMAYPVQVVKLDSTTGDFIDEYLTGAPDDYAFCYASNPADGNCNKVRWEIPVLIHASIAQWIHWTIDGTRWDWFVRKPGYYAADCISAFLASNGDVLVDYEGFANLKALVPNGHDEEIEVWYAFEYGQGIAGIVNNNEWVPAPQLNDDDDLIIEAEANLPDYNIHNGIRWKLWNKIFVGRCNSACEYEDEALITLVLYEQKPWIDPETGYFAGFPIP